QRTRRNPYRIADVPRAPRRLCSAAWASTARRINNNGRSGIASSLALLAMTSTPSSRGGTGSRRSDPVAHVSAPQLKAMLLDGGELALLDVREAGQFGQSHLLFATPLPYGRLELDVGAL